MSKRSVAARSLWPREHGAYIQLLLPLVTALLVTQPGPAAILLAFGAGLAFLASEPLRVLLGDRGPRMQELAGRRARWRLVALGTSATIAGGLGLALGPRSSLWTSLLAAPPIGFLVIAARRRTLDTLGGELVAAVALCGAAAPVAVAGGMAVGAAIAMWCAWSLAYMATVIAVHHVIACHRCAKPPGHARRWGVLVGVALGTLIVFDSTTWFAAPLVGVALAVITLTPAATRLRTIGFTFLAGSAVSAVCAIASVEPRDRGRALEREPHGARACRGSRIALVDSSLGMLAARSHLREDLGLDLGAECRDRGKDDALFELEMGTEIPRERRGDNCELCRGPLAPLAGLDVAAHPDEATDVGDVSFVVRAHRRERSVDLRTCPAQTRNEALVFVREVQRKCAGEVAMDIGSHRGGGGLVDSIAGGEAVGGAQERTDPQVALLKELDEPFRRVTSTERDKH